MLRAAGAGFGGLALAGLYNSLLRGDDLRGGDLRGGDLRGGDRAHNNDLPAGAHHRPRAKRIIFLFMHGGPSQVDTFDYKPALERDHGKPLPFPKPRVVSSATGNLLKSPWKFQRRGQSGAWVSELFPEVAQRVDDLCVINSMHCSNSRHGAALLELHTGSDTFIRPSMGVLDHLRPGHRERESAGLYLDLSYAHAWRRKRLQFRVPAGGLSRHADRQRQYSGGASQDPLYRQRRFAALGVPRIGVGLPRRSGSRTRRPPGGPGIGIEDQIVRTRVSHAGRGSAAATDRR